jgi:hypothetical protein
VFVFYSLFLYVYLSYSATFLLFLFLFLVSFFSFPPAALGPGVYSTVNRNDYQKQIRNISDE